MKKEEKNEEGEREGGIIRRDCHWLEYYAIIKHCVYRV